MYFFFFPLCYYPCRINILLQGTDRKSYSSGIFLACLYESCWLEWSFILFFKNELGHSASHRFCLLVSHRLDFYNILSWLSKLCLLYTYKLLSSFRTKYSSSRQGMLKLLLQLSLFKLNFLNLCLQKCGHWTAPIYKFLISFFFKLDMAKHDK